MDEGPARLPDVKGNQSWLAHLRHAIAYRLLRGDVLIANATVWGEFELHRPWLDTPSTMRGCLFLGPSCSPPPTQTRLFTVRGPA